jgi:hypothetical protein
MQIVVNRKRSCLLPQCGFKEGSRAAHRPGCWEGRNSRPPCRTLPRRPQPAPCQPRKAKASDAGVPGPLQGLLSASLTARWALGSARAASGAAARVRVPASHRPRRPAIWAGVGPRALTLRKCAVCRQNGGARRLWCARKARPSSRLGDEAQDLRGRRARGGIAALSRALARLAWEACWGRRPPRPAPARPQGRRTSVSVMMPAAAPSPSTTYTRCREWPTRAARTWGVRSCVCARACVWACVCE